mmetsp:Transcript_88734/g.206520  ORF Transcript_88734/g.206520 Transcript_88734/m.206520 type:complete len:127 (+) Transcript_88734:1237-1617(+)
MWLRDYVPDPSARGSAAFASTSGGATECGALVRQVGEAAAAGGSYSQQESRQTQLGTECTANQRTSVAEIRFQGLPAIVGASLSDCGRVAATGLHTTSICSEETAHPFACLLACSMESHSSITVQA